MKTCIVTCSNMKNSIWILDSMSGTRCQSELDDFYPGKKTVMSKEKKGNCHSSTNMPQVEFWPLPISSQLNAWWNFSCLCKFTFQMTILPLLTTDCKQHFVSLVFWHSMTKKVLTAECSLVTMRQATSHGSKDWVSFNVHTPAIPSRAITLHFLITAVCGTLWHKASHNGVLGFLV